MNLRHRYRSLFIIICSILSNTIGAMEQNVHSNHEQTTIPDHEIQFNLNNCSMGGAISIGYQTMGMQKFDGSPNFNNFYNPDAVSNVTASEFLARNKDEITHKPGNIERFSFGHDVATVHNDDGAIQFDHEGNIQLNQEAFRTIGQIIADHEQCGKTVELCLFHHTWPIDMTTDQFADGFSDPEYTRQWIIFAKKVVDQFGDRVTRWIPFNEPTGYVAAAYVSGMYPPYIKKNKNGAGAQALRNICLAELEITAYILEKNPNAVVMRVEQDRTLRPADPTKYLDCITASIGNYLSRDVTINYFNTGKLSWGIWSKLLEKTVFSHGQSWLAGYLELNEQQKETLKKLHIAVSYYTVNQMDGTKPTPLAGYDVSDNDQAIYPEGLYQALERWQSLAEQNKIAGLMVGEMGYNIKRTKDNKPKIEQAYKDSFAQIYRFNQDYPHTPVTGVRLWGNIEHIQEWAKPDKQPEKTNYHSVNQCENIVHLMNNGYYPA